jgi:hypothetical protein
MDKLFVPYNIVKEHFANNASLNKNKKKMCSRTLMYYFISLVITIYALSLAVNRIQRTPQPSELTSMLLIIVALFCSPCYLLFELVSMMMRSGPSYSSSRVFVMKPYIN